MTLPSWCAVIVATASLGCAAPLQSGMLDVLPGATERAMLAMRMGYLGFEREAVPGQVRQAMVPELLPNGAARRAKVGDYVLENGFVLAAVTAIDGTARGGRLVDLATKPKLIDGLGDMELRVLGQVVVYDSLRTGFDESTNAAYIEVSGRVDQRAQGGALVTVSTRYDAAPGVEAILVHTHLKVDSGDIALDAPHPLLEEKLSAQGFHRALIDPEGSYGASFGAEGGYLLRALGDPGTIGDGEVPVFRVPATAAPGTGGVLVVTRVVAALARSDTAALAVAVARTQGDPVGDVEVRVHPAEKGAAAPKSGALTFLRDDGRCFDVSRADAKGEDSHFEAKLPAGKYHVVFEGNPGKSGTLVRSDPVAVAIAGERLAFVSTWGRVSTVTGDRATCGRFFPVAATGDVVPGD